MIDIRIVCTHDALKLAETLTRLLEAEQHRVRLTFGRQAMSALELARTEHEAVMLIWSQDARSQIYMLEWARKIDPLRLIELARTADCPKIQRKAPVVDFTHWRGERGGRAWDALNERLRVVARVIEPPKPAPMRAMAAFGVVTAVAMAGAITQRLNTEFAAPAADAANEEIASVDASAGVGGPLNSLEPASLDDELRFGPFADMALIDGSESLMFADVPEIEAQTLRRETLLERLNAFNPLRQQQSNDDPQ